MQEQKSTHTISSFLSMLAQPTELSKMDDPNAFLAHPLVLQVIALCQNDPTQGLQIVEYILKHFPKLDIYKVGMCCSILPQVFDYRKPPVLVMQLTLGLFLKYLSLCNRYMQKTIQYQETSSIFSQTASAVKAWRSIDYVISNANFLFSSYAGARAKLRETPNAYEMMNAQEPFLRSLTETIKLYRLFDDRTIYFIHPKRRIGFSVKVFGIQNFFQLFTLVLDELNQKASGILPLFHIPDPSAVGVATGDRKYDIDRKIDIKTEYAFYTVADYQKAQKNQQARPINGLLNPSSISVFEKGGILIMDDSQNTDTVWESRFFKPYNIHLTSGVQLKKILSPEQVHNFLSKL